MSKNGFDLLFRELARGAGRRAGFDLTKVVEKELGNRIVNPNSKFRSILKRFTLPGTFKGANSKMYTLMDSFQEEYTTTRASFQASWYIEQDIKFIEDKLRYTQRLVVSDAEERAYERLLETWSEIKSQF